MGDQPILQFEKVKGRGKISSATMSYLMSILGIGLPAGAILLYVTHGEKSAPAVGIMSVVGVVMCILVQCCNTHSRSFWKFRRTYRQPDDLVKRLQFEAAKERQKRMQEQDSEPLIERKDFEEPEAEVEEEEQQTQIDVVEDVPEDVPKEEVSPAQQDLSPPPYTAPPTSPPQEDEEEQQTRV